MPLLVRLNAAAFLVMCAYAAIYTTVASYVQLLGGGAATTGLVVAASAGLRAGVGYAFGSLAHHLGYRATMIAGLGLLAGGSLCTALHQGLVGLLAGLPLQALGSGAFAGAAVAMLERHTSARTHDLARYQGAQLLGISVGPLLGGILAARWGFGAPFTLQLALAVVAVGIILADPALRLGMHIDVSTERFAVISAAVAGAYGVAFVRTSALWLVLPYIAHRKYGMGIAAVGALITAGVLANLLVLPFAEYLSHDRRRRAFGVGGGIMVVAGTALTLGSWCVMPWFAAVSIGFGAGMLMPLFAVLAPNAPMRWARTATSFAFISAPAIVGILLSRATLELALCASVAVAILVVACALAVASANVTTS